MVHRRSVSRAIRRCECSCEARAAGRRRAQVAAEVIRELAA